ncbi:hypothetical protein [Streptomyces hydrogenans]|uniref:hypothetical protein n=1 Tax=Streptomyces hydrogenans TaxID=1873719 RepID=UPI00381C23D2
MSSRLSQRLGRLEQQVAADGFEHNGSSVDIVLVASALVRWPQEHPGVLPPIPSRPYRDTLAAFSDRVWRTLLHQSAGHTTRPGTCRTCQPDPTEDVA